MRPVDNKNTAPHPIYDGTFENSTGVQLLDVTQHVGGAVRGFLFNDLTGSNPLYTFFRNGVDFNGLVPIGAGAINITLTPIPAAVQQIGAIHVRPGIPNPDRIDPPVG